VENRWVDPLQEPAVSPADTRWVGQWWLGYIISAIFVLLSLLPLFLFKKQPPSNIVELNSSENSELNEELINQSTTSSQMSFGNSITGKFRYFLKDMARSFFRSTSKLDATAFKQSIHACDSHNVLRVHNRRFIPHFHAEISSRAVFNRFLNFCFALWRRSVTRFKFY